MAHPQAQSLPTPPPSLLVPTDLWICLFWTFPVRGIVLPVASFVSGFLLSLKLHPMFHSFLWPNNIQLCGRTPTLSHHPFDRHLGHYHLLVNVNRAAGDIGVQGFV